MKLVLIEASAALMGRIQLIERWLLETVDKSARLARQLLPVQIILSEYSVVKPPQLL